MATWGKKMGWYCFVLFFRASVKGNVAEKIQKFVDCAWTKKYVLEDQLSLFFTFPRRMTMPNLVSQLSKTMAQNFEGKMFRVSLKPARKYTLLCNASNVLRCYATLMQYFALRCGHEMLGNTLRCNAVNDYALQCYVEHKRKASKIISFGIKWNIMSSYELGPARNETFLLEAMEQWRRWVTLDIKHIHMTAS